MVDRFEAGPDEVPQLKLDKGKGQDDEERGARKRKRGLDDRGPDD